MAAHLLLVLFLSSLALSHADLYGNPSPPIDGGVSPPPSDGGVSPPPSDGGASPPPSDGGVSPPPSDGGVLSPPPPGDGGLAPPPPFAVRGKVFPPESSLCRDPATTNPKCFGKVLRCPKQCPTFKPADPKAKACVVNCKKCESICINPKPNCEGKGAACQDPRFVGGDGIMFYFHGKSKHHFSLVSDPNLQINARFIGLRPAGRTRDFTWIQALGIMFDSYAFTLGAKKVSQWDNSVDQFTFSYAGVPIYLDAGHLSTWSSPDGRLKIDRITAVNSVTVTAHRLFEIKASVVPVTKEDDKIHKYGIPSGDSFAHLEVQFKFFGLSEKVEGVMGQTYRPGFKNPVKRGVPMPVMSGEDKFMTSSLLAADCKNCIFSPEVPSGINALVLDPAGSATLDCTGKTSNGYGVVCRR